MSSVTPEAVVEPKVYPNEEQFLALSDHEQLQWVLWDRAWAYDRERAGAFRDVGTRYVAVVNKSVVGTGNDYAALRIDAARAGGVHPEQVVIVNVDSRPLIPERYLP